MPTTPTRGFDETAPAYEVRLLTLRIDILIKEHDEERTERKALSDRIAKMEKTFQRGAGMMIMMPVIGTIIGIVFAYAKFIFGNGK